MTNGNCATALRESARDGISDCRRQTGNGNTAADEVGEQLFAPAFAAIRSANDGSVPEEQLRAAFAERCRLKWITGEGRNASPVIVAAFCYRNDCRVDI